MTGAAAVSAQFLRGCSASYIAWVLVGEARPLGYVLRRAMAP